jgi:hypothetical protein
MQCSSQGHVAFIRQGRDHQSWAIAEVLVAVKEARVGLSHDAIIDISFPVVP